MLLLNVHEALQCPVFPLRKPAAKWEQLDEDCVLPFSLDINMLTGQPSEVAALCELAIAG